MGTFNSNEVNNLTLHAKDSNNTVLASKDFSVRTWPKSIKCGSSDAEVRADSYGVVARMEWVSESGVNGHLQEILLGEELDYGTMFCPPFCNADHTGPPGNSGAHEDWPAGWVVIPNPA
jgi:hypothetical protein